MKNSLFSGISFLGHEEDAVCQSLVQIDLEVHPLRPPDLSDQACRITAEHQTFACRRQRIAEHSQSAQEPRTDSVEGREINDDGVGRTGPAEFTQFEIELFQPAEFQRAKCARLKMKNQRSTVGDELSCDESC